MKITTDFSTTTGRQGGVAGPAGGDLGGGFPAPVVQGIQGIPISPVSPTDGQEMVYDAASQTIKWESDTPSGLSSVSDPQTTVSPASALTLNDHQVENLGGGDAKLHVLASRYGAEDELHTVATSGSAQTLPATANAHDITLTANCTLTLPSLVSGFANAITLILRQDGTGSRTVTWPGSVSWIAGTAPTLKTAPSAVDVVTLFTVDGGTTWGGIAVGAAGSTYVWRPLMASDGTNWWVVVDGSGNAIMV